MTKMRALFRSMDKPIFIFSLARSGSTLVQRVINSLDDTIIYGEHAGILKGAASTYRLFSTPDTAMFCTDNVDRAEVAKRTLDQLRNSKSFPATCCGFSTEHLRDAHRNFVRSLIHCVPEVQHYRWGFKEIRYFETQKDFVFDMLYDLFPEATFVFTVRNPADYVVSNEGMASWPGPRQLKLDVWRNQVGGFARYHRCFPQNTVMVRYEDFVDPATGAARNLIERLGHAFTEKQEQIIFKMGKVGATVQKPVVDDELRDAIRAVCSNADTFSVYPEYLEGAPGHSGSLAEVPKAASADGGATPAGAGSAVLSVPPAPTIEGVAAVLNSDSPAVSYFRGLMNEHFHAGKLKDITPPDFRREIYHFLTISDGTMEGYADPKKQRDLSIKFHWGHNHDFGYFKVNGRMNDRHLTIPAAFVEQMSALPTDLSGKNVLDIGPWTGGTSLLFSAMGAKVVAVEEVKKYAEAIRFLKKSFAVENLEVVDKTLYELNNADFYDRFDYVYMAGIVYHVTDPILALRTAFNSLKDGGTCLVESVVVNSPERVARYDGPQITFGGSANLLNRGGWKWLTPSIPALQQMMSDAGFSDIRMAGLNGNGNAVLMTGVRAKHCDITRAGLSAPAVR